MSFQFFRDIVLSLENLNLNRIKNLSFDIPFPRPIKYAIEYYEGLINLEVDEEYTLEAVTSSVQKRSFSNI